MDKKRPREDVPNSVELRELPVNTRIPDGNPEFIDDHVPGDHGAMTGHGKASGDLYSERDAPAPEKNILTSGKGSPADEKDTPAPEKASTSEKEENEQATSPRES